MRRDDRRNSPRGTGSYRGTPVTGQLLRERASPLRLALAFYLDLLFLGVPLALFDHTLQVPFPDYAGAPIWARFALLVLVEVAVMRRETTTPGRWSLGIEFLQVFDPGPLEQSLAGGRRPYVDTELRMRGNFFTLLAGTFFVVEGTRAFVSLTGSPQGVPFFGGLIEGGSGVMAAALLGTVELSVGLGILRSELWAPLAGLGHLAIQSASFWVTRSTLPAPGAITQSAFESVRLTPEQAEIVREMTNPSVAAALAAAVLLLLLALVRIVRVRRALLQALGLWSGVRIG